MIWEMEEQIMGADGVSGGDRARRALELWLGLAEDEFTRQKTVKFGDASAVGSGRIWSLLVVAALLLLWVARLPPSAGSSRSSGRRSAALGTGSSSSRPRASATFRSGSHVGISVYRVLSGVFYGALVGMPLGFAMGAVAGRARALRPDRRVHAADPAAGADPARHPLVRHRRDGQDIPPVPRRALHHDDRGAVRACRACA